MALPYIIGSARDGFEFSDQVPATSEDEHVQFFIYQALWGARAIALKSVVWSTRRVASKPIGELGCDLKIHTCGVKQRGGSAERSRRVRLRGARVEIKFTARSLHADVPDTLVDFHTGRDAAVSGARDYHRLGAQHSKAVDVWAAGCILAELLGRKLLLAWAPATSTGAHLPLSDGDDGHHRQRPRSHRQGDLAATPAARAGRELKRYIHMGIRFDVTCSRTSWCSGCRHRQTSVRRWRTPTWSSCTSGTTSRVGPKKPPEAFFEQSACPLLN